MTFPGSPRVIYEKNPLETVVSQLRFPPILRIAAETTVYQERVRERYPLLQERPGFDLGMMGLPPEVAKVVSAELPLALRGGHAVFDFATADEVWKISLSQDFLALTTVRYVRWEEFRAHLQFALQALLEEYSPAFFTRIGLRYRDVIRRPVLGLQGCAWTELLQPHIAAELSSPAVADAVVRAVHDVTINLEKGLGQVRIQHGLGEASDAADVSYLIDADFFTEERTETSHALERLDYFNSQAARLFRWCIRDRVHEAMGPRPI